jgi:hypothetical protein
MVTQGDGESAADGICQITQHGATPPRRSSSHDGTNVMHPVVDPAEARGLIGLDYLAAALADLAASVRLVIFPGGVQLFLSLLDALRVDDVAE